MRLLKMGTNLMLHGRSKEAAARTHAERWHAIVWLALVVAALLAGCDIFQANQAEGLRASGIVETTEVIAASELGGRVVEVMVAAGDTVAQGDVLFRLENEVLAAQETEVQARLIAAEATQENARAALGLAETNVEAAEIAIEMAQVNLEIQRRIERQTAVASGITAFNQPLPAEFSLPDWYFQREEVLRASESAFEEAQQELEATKVEYETLVAEIGQDTVQEAEERLGQARIAFMVADELASRDIGPNRQVFMDDAVEELLDDARTELEDAQDAFDDLLTTAETRELLEVRAQLAVAVERVETTRDQMRIAMAGDHSLAVLAAQLAVRQAEIGLAQAEAAQGRAQTELEQAGALVSLAQAALMLIQGQIEALTVQAAVDGVVFVRGIETGEVLLPGAPALTLGEMDRLTITVFIPEDRYGRIGLNDPAVVEVDSYPGELFEARVTRIADQAEFTPRNVQTEEERRTTVFAIELFVNNSAGKLKPGMPATVSFN